MFIKRVDLVDLLEVIDCENGYVDIDHLIECCNNLPSSGMSVWCMKCGNNGECMYIDKPDCFQPRAEQTEPQYDFGEYADRLWEIAYERGKREALEQTEPNSSEIPNNCEPQTDCAWK